MDHSSHATYWPHKVTTHVLVLVTPSRAVSNPSIAPSSLALTYDSIVGLADF